MMSDFMFPIYLATNKIQKRGEKRAEGHRERSEEKQKGERPVVGQEKQERGKAKAR